MYLALDFGASRIKSVLFSNKKKILNTFETKGSFFFSKSGIVKKEFFIESFKKHLNFYSNKKNIIKCIITCSEMHGYFLNSNTISDYFSWRCKYSEFKFSKKFKKSYLNSTGLTLREGTPYVKIKDLKKKCNIIGIPEFLCINLGKYNNCLHSTYAQSLGVYDYKCKSLKIRSELKHINENIKINYNYKNYIGDVFFKGKFIRMLGGFGDMQCSDTFHKLKENQAILNIGTGSQIILKKKFDNFDFRISFNKKIYGCITHIPAGRFLINISKILKLNQKIFFKKLQNIKTSDFDKINKKKFSRFDLKTFHDKISKKITQKKMYKEKIFILITYIFVNNYIKKFKKLKNISELIIKGGIPKKLKIIKLYLKRYFMIKKSNFIDIIIDDTNEFIKNNLDKIVKI